MLPPLFYSPIRDNAGDALAAMSISMSASMAKTLGKSSKFATSQHIAAEFIGRFDGVI